LCLCTHPIYAEEFADTALIRFRRSQHSVDTSLVGNAASLTRMLDRLDGHRSAADSVFIIRRVMVLGSASPEGSASFNRQLAERRAQAIFDYFRDHGALPDSIPAEFRFSGCDWGRLYHLVEADSGVPSRSRVLSILAPAADGSGSTGRCRKMLAGLKKLDGGRPYAWLLANQFPALRAARLCVAYDLIPAPSLTVSRADLPELSGVTASFTPPNLFSVSYLANNCASTSRRRFYAALKTNLLSDALAVPEIGAEFYLGRHFSLGADWMYAGWGRDGGSRLWRIYGGDLSLRWWFGRAAAGKPLTGHHLGVYAGAFTCDFALGGKGHMGGRPEGSLWDRCMVNTGVEYGYSLPVARRLNLDFSIGVGYVGGIVERYDATTPLYLWQSSVRKTWIGPTRAAVSLVWLLGPGNYNNMSRKGGSI
ncbi:MAG: DUF3575 domain-containing protein, partial [Muribaculaceae bacterium]|nr:DUF3575 domain-containing protein [Muribaculaceae bacterium]